MHKVCIKLIREFIKKRRVKKLVSSVQHLVM